MKSIEQLFRHNRHVQVAAAIVLCLAISLVVGSRSARAQEQEFGYSYLRMKFAGQPITNFVVNEKYRGWLEIFGVTARMVAVAKRSPNGTAPRGAAPSEKDDQAQWPKLAEVLASGRAGPGELNFAAGYNGGVDPLYDALKRKAVIKSAELDFYDEATAKLIGKYRIHGIRVLKIENVPASACAMDSVTMSFQSVKKI